MPKSGKDTVLILQVEDKAKGDKGCIVGSLTETKHAIENDLADEQTKFGRVLAYGPTSESLEFTCYGESDDEGQKEVMRAIKDKKEIKAWLVDKTVKENDKHDAVFARCLIESVEKEEPADGFVELNGTLQVIGESKLGELDKLPDEFLNAGSYDFEKPGATTGNVRTKK